MQVIFLEDVANVGKIGQIKEVADGYARNYLIPRKLAALARPQDIKELEARIKTRARHEAKTEAEMKSLASTLEGKEITLKARAGQQERLYGSITTADISAGLETSLNVNVDKRKIELGEPIHKLGTYDVLIKFGKEIAAKIKVTIIAEDNI